MNRRKVLLGIFGLVGTVAAVAPDVASDPGLPLELSSDLFILDAEEFRNLAKSRKIRWVRSTNLYTAMRQGWQEHPWHITRFASTASHPDGVAHLMVRNG